MKHVWIRLLLAANGNEGGNAENAGVPALPKHVGIEQTTDIMDNFTLPKGTGQGGRRGSKYMDDDIATKVENLKPGQGIIVPFKDDVTVARQLQAMGTVLRNYGKEQEVSEVKDDAGKVTRAGQKAWKFSVGLIKDKGIGVRRDS